MFVEVVRLLIVLMSTAAGYELAGPGAAVPGALLGAAGGYVVGGVVGRSTLRALGRVEARTRRIGPIELLLGAVGSLATGALGVTVGLPAVLFLPHRWGWPILLLVVWVAATAGFRIGAGRSDELARAGSVLGPPPAPPGPEAGEAIVVDASALVDGRVVALSRQGFLRRHLVVTRGVTAELRALADGSDPAGRRRGRRGLDSLESLTADPRLRVHVVDGGGVPDGDVDAGLLAATRAHGAALLTVDGPLGGLARSEGLPVIDLQRAAESLAPMVHTGDRVELVLAKAGREPGQGVGFLDDGSMVVVGDAADRVGSTVEVEVASSVRTSVGRMFFAVLAEPARPCERGSAGSPGAT